MKTADLINRYRIIPRLVITGYAVMIWAVAQWFMSLNDPSATQAAFVSTMVGVSAAVFGFYVNSGCKDDSKT